MARRWLVAAVAWALSGAACGDDASSGGVDAGRDAGREVDAGSLPPWPRTLPPASELGAVGGYSVARTIIHLHSPLSHDACDGEGWVDGALADEACLSHLREALCVLQIDAAMLTDHAPHVNEVAFEDALWIAEGDEPVMDGDGNVVASRLSCPSGRSVLVTVGSENELMPVALTRHPGDPADPEALESTYDADGPDAVTTFREAGALVLVPHTESRPLDHLRTLGMDGIEIYNVHANLAPDIREEHLGLDGWGFATHLLAFTDRRSTLASDLVFLAFFEENQNDLGKWDSLLAEGLRVPGLAGSDAHENTFPDPMPDGERADSYRRVLRWFSNHVLVPEVTLGAIREAIAAGRYYVAFEAFGSPVGFTFTAGDVHMGDTAAAGAELVVTRPSLPDDHPQEPAPAVRIRILRAEAGGAVEVAAGEGTELRHVADTPGAYRAEVRILPEHARPYLGRLDDELLRELVWVYSNPIYVE